MSVQHLHAGPHCVLQVGKPHEEGELMLRNGAGQINLVEHEPERLVAHLRMRGCGDELSRGLHESHSVRDIDHKHPARNLDYWVPHTLALHGHKCADVIRRAMTKCFAGMGDDYQALQSW